MLTNEKIYTKELDKKQIKTRLKDFALSWSTLLALGLICIFFTIYSPTFLSKYNLMDILIQIAPLGIISAGLTVCVLGGEFDVSMSSVLTLSGVVAAVLMRSGSSAFAAIVVAILVGMIAGSINASMVVYLKVPSLIATLAISVVLNGLALLASGGFRIYKGMKAGFTFMGTGNLLGIPMPIAILILWSLFIWIMLAKTTIGKKVFSIGVNPEASLLSGVNLSGYKFLSMIFSSIAASIAAIIVVARIGAAEPFSQFAYVLDAFAAVTIGTTVLLKAHPHMPGTAVGVIALGVLNNGLTMLGAPFFLQNVLKGILILLAVAGNVAIQLRRE